MNPSDVIVAVDPGRTGGFAWSEASMPADGPAFSPVVGKYSGTPDLVSRFLSGRFDDSRVRFVVEDVHASPIMNPQSAFAFGKNFGEWLAVAHAVAGPGSIHAVSPQTWQKGVPGIKGSEGNARKRKLKEYAVSLFPHLEPTLAVCDAILILRWALLEGGSLWR